MPGGAGNEVRRKYKVVGMFGSHEPSWNSPSRVAGKKRVVAPSARKHYYKDWDDDELESAAAAGELEDQN